MEIAGRLEHPHPPNPHYNWRCHSPSALFLCIYEDEFKRNDEGLRGDGQESRKHTEEISQVSQEQNSDIPEPTFQLSELISWMSAEP